MRLARGKFVEQPTLLAACLLDQAAYLAKFDDRLTATEQILLEAYRLLGAGIKPSPAAIKVCHELQSIYQRLNRPDEAGKWAAKAAE